MIARLVLATVAALTLWPSTALAQSSYVWNGTQGGLWSNALNWTPNGPPGVAGDAATFNGVSGTVSVDTAVTVGQLSFNATTASSFTLALAGGSLTLNNGAGGNSAITAGATAAGATVAADLTVAGNGNLDLSALNTAAGTTGLVLSGAITASGGTVAIKQGLVVLSGANTYSSATRIDAGGILQAAPGAGLSANSNLVFNGGLLSLPAGSNPFTLTVGTGPGQVRFTGSGGFAGVSGTNSIVLNNALSNLTWGAGNFLPDGATLTFGQPTDTTQSVSFATTIDLNGGVRAIVANGSAITMTHDLYTLTDSVGGGGITKTGGATLRLNGTNTYTGPTTVAAGNLEAAQGHGLPTASNLNLAGGTFTPDPIGVGPISFTRTVGTGSGQVQIGGGGSGFLAGSRELIVRLNNGTGTVAWGSPGFVPSGQPLVLSLYGAPTTSGPSIDFQNGLDLNGAAQTIVANGIGSSLVLIRVSGPVVNTGAAGAGLTKTGTGTLELAGTNTYDGPTTATGGVLRAGVGTGLPAAGNLTLDGAVFEGSGTATFSRSVGAGPGQVQWGPNGGGLSAYNGTLTVRLNNGTGTVAWGSAGFIPAGKPLVVGAYTDTTQGAANSAGVLDVQNGIDLAGSFRTIDAHFLPPSTVGTTVGGLVRFSGPIGSSSGTPGVLITGSSLSPVVEFAGVNTYSGQTTTFGPVLRANPGQGLPAASNVTVNGGGLELTGPVTFSRTLGTGAGQVQVLSGSLGAYNGVAAVQLNGGTGTLTWGVSSSSFLPNLASTFALTVRAAAGFAGQTVLDFQNGLNLNGTTRTIQVLDYTTTAGNLARISGPITNSTGTAGLTVQGSGTSTGQNGTLELTGANTYTGTTTVSQQATLRAADGVGLPTSSNLTLNNGVYESPGTATFTRALGNTAGRVQWASGADGGFAAGAGTLTVRLNNGAGTLTWGSTILFVGTNANLVFGSRTGAGLVDFQNGLDLGTGVVRTVELRGGATARLSGVVSNANALQVTGPGTLELTAANTFTLGVGITSGATVLVKNATGSGTGTGTISVGAGGVFGGTGTAAGGVTAASGSGSFPPGMVRAGDATGAGTLTLGNGLSFGGGVLGVRVADGSVPSSTPGGSTVGTLPNPTSNNFLNITGGTFTFGPSNPTVTIDGTGTAFQQGQPYSYRVGQAAGQNLSGLSMTTQSRFTAVGFAASSFALTGDAGGGIYVSFTTAAVPEPGLMLLWAPLGVVAVCRSRRRRFGS